MAVSNIDRFNELTGLVLVELYAKFPVPKTLVAKNFVEPATQWCEHVACEVPSKEAEFFYATVIWLESSGYLSYKEVSPHYIRDVVLTANGLEVLKASPASLNNGATFGEVITTAAKEGGKETFRASVSELIGVGAKIFGAAVGLP